MLKDNESELVRILLLSTYTHVSGTIKNKKNKATYLKAMRACYYVCSAYANGSNILKMRSDLQHMMDRYPTRFTFRLEILSHTQEYYMLGITHALDIVNSIISRFITGSRHDDAWFIENILGDDFVE